MNSNWFVYNGVVFFKFKLNQFLIFYQQDNEKMNSTQVPEEGTGDSDLEMIRATLD